MTLNLQDIQDYLMRMRVDIYHHFPESTPDPRMDQMLDLLRQIITKENRIMATIADIQTAVTNERTVIDSVVTLLNGLAQQLRDAIAANDPAAIQAVADQISSNTQALADAVTSNTTPTV